MEVVGQAGGFGASGVNNDELPTALPQCFEAAPDVRYGHQAAVRGHRVAANTDEQVGIVDVRNRKQNLVTKHLQAGQHVR